MKMGPFSCIWNEGKFVGEMRGRMSVFCEGEMGK